MLAHTHDERSLLAVVASGQARDYHVSNPVVGHTPVQSWPLLAPLNHHHGRALRIFACTDAPLPPGPVPLAGQWVFDSPSQFSRLLACLELVEPDLARPRHSAYLRLRPDSLVLGRLPPSLLREPEPDAVYVRWRVYSNAHVKQTQLRDSMECGMCDQWCECAQRKYGQVLFHTNGSCGVPTDKVFLFGPNALLPMARALRNYSLPDASHPARSPETHSDHCVDAGRMVETGFGRVLEDEGLRLLPLPLRITLNRELQSDVPSWRSAVSYTHLTLPTILLV